MKRSFALLSLVAFVVVAQECFASLLVDDAPAAVNTDVNDEPQIIAHYDIGVPETGNGFRVEWDLFDNTANFTGQAAMNGGTGLLNGLLTTRFVSDDLYVGQWNVNKTVTGFDWCVANLNYSVITDARMIINFHQDNLTNAPFVLITSYSFLIRTIPAGVTCFHRSALFSIPSPTIWMGISFDNSGTPSTTAAQLDNLGLGVFDPPISGSSLDEDFMSPGPSQGNQEFPVGSVRPSPYSGNPVANYGFRLSPEPGSFLLLTLAALVLVRRNGVFPKP